MTLLTNQYTAAIPRSKGTYALIMRLQAERLIQVGKLGLFVFPAGYYLYIGSAFGPGGLAARLKHHLATDFSTKSRHWHIDYLRRWAPVTAVWLGEHSTPREHDWAQQAGRLAGTSCPAPRFGASDCRCHAHLFHFSQSPEAESFSKALSLAFPGDRPMQIIGFVEQEAGRRSSGQFPY
jgi:Uri superfamily endonuclease